MTRRCGDWVRQDGINRGEREGLSLNPPGSPGGGSTGVEQGWIRGVSGAVVGLGIGGLGSVGGWLGWERAAGFGRWLVMVAEPGQQSWGSARRLVRVVNAGGAAVGRGR